MKNILVKSINLLIAGSVIFMLGCGTQYTFNNQSYTKPSEALAAHSNFSTNIETGIKPITDSPIASSVMVVTPSKETCQKLGITKTGSPSKEMMDYLGEYLKSDFAYFNKYIQKSELFTSVEHKIVDFPAKFVKDLDKKYDAVVYLDMVSPSQASWYLLSSNSDKPQQINFDNIAAPGLPKVNSWLMDIKSKLEK